MHCCSDWAPEGGGLEGEGLEGLEAGCGILNVRNTFS